MNWIQLPSGYTDIQQYTKDLVECINKYEWLIQNHAVDFLVSGYWHSKVPTEWHCIATEFSMHDLIQMASHFKLPDRKQWPESLVEFVATCQSLGLPRDPPSIESKFQQAPSDLLVFSGMSVKKRLEVQIMSDCVSELCRTTDVETVVDMGAGQGYLDSLLVRSGLNVVSIDDDDIQTCGAKRRADRTSATTGIGKWTIINRRVALDESLDGIVEGEALGGWMLCGLHACGDLTVSVIKQFLLSDAKALCVVGCCYNAITEKTSSSGAYGFPLSTYLQDRNVHLGVCARQVACQCTGRWGSDGLQEEEAVINFRRHFYRALVQKLMVERGIGDAKVGRMRSSVTKKGFSAYFHKAMDKMLGSATTHVHTDECDPERLQRLEADNADGEKQVSVVWTLRAMLSGAIESLILVDRFMFLSQHKLDMVQLRPLFPHLDSPRNMAIIATKK